MQEELTKTDKRVLLLQFVLEAIFSYARTRHYDRKQTTAKDKDHKNSEKKGKNSDVEKGHRAVAEPFDEEQEVLPLTEEQVNEHTPLQQ